MPFNMFPYSNLHNFNLDWILNVVKTMAASVETAARTVETYAARLTQVETSVQEITPAAAGAVRHDVSQSLDAANRRRAATNIHAVSYDPHLLSADEQAQARHNIGALGSGDIPPAANAVLYTEQNLTELQKAQARSNIEAAAASAIPDVSDVVRYSAQARPPEQQLRARTNIGAAYSGDVTDLADRVTGVEDVTALAITSAAQTLTDAQKTQARTNIGAGSAVDVQTNANEIQTIYGELNKLYPFVVTFSGRDADGNAACDKTWAQIQAAGDNIKVIYRVSETEFYTLTPHIDSILKATYLDINDLGNPSSNYTQIICRQNNENLVRCSFKQVSP